MKDLEKVLSDLFAKLPDLPPSVRAIIVKLAPYLVLIAIIFSVPAILAIVGLGFIGSSMMAASGMWGYAGSGTLAVAYTVVSTVLLVLAVKGLFARTQSGWKYMYYNTLVGGVYALLRADIIGFIVGTGVSLYVLFQVRASYR